MYVCCKHSKIKRKEIFTAAEYSKKKCVLRTMSLSSAIGEKLIVFGPFLASQNPTYPFQRLYCSRALQINKTIRQPTVAAY